MRCTVSDHPITPPKPKSTYVKQQRAKKAVANTERAAKERVKRAKKTIEQAEAKLEAIQEVKKAVVRNEPAIIT